MSTKKFMIPSALKGLRRMTQDWFERLCLAFLECLTSGECEVILQPSKKMAAILEKLNLRLDAFFRLSVSGRTLDHVFYQIAFAGDKSAVFAANLSSFSYDFLTPQDLSSLQDLEDIFGGHASSIAEHTTLSVSDLIKTERDRSYEFEMSIQDAWMQAYISTLPARWVLEVEEGEFYIDMYYSPGSSSTESSQSDEDEEFEPFARLKIGGGTDIAQYLGKEDEKMIWAKIYSES